MQKLNTILLKINIFIVCILSLVLGVVNPIIIKTAPAMFCARNSEQIMAPSIKELLQNLFRIKPKIEEKTEKVYVYLGGMPLGFTINSEGVIVVAISNENNGGIVVGDIIKKVNDKNILTVEDIYKQLNSQENQGKEVKLNFIHNNEEKLTTLKPIYDALTQSYKLGFWVRDNSAGVGTLTFIRSDNFRFGALGHPVCDIDTGSIIPVADGKIYKCNIIGYKRGVKGKPGELKGLFLRNGVEFGMLDENNKFGVYGQFDKNFINIENEKLYEVANRNEVKSGKAKIRCTIDGNTPEEFDIEIVKTYFQSTKDNKSMFIRVTDKRLLETTGGIVQGMSGSPIIQNGKFVGAVTHVFVSDPTKGYGVYADWMVNN